MIFERIKTKGFLDREDSRGFSLIETLVAITILLVAVGGPLTIAHRALSDANIAKNQTIAIFLAQDAIEYIKNIRDENNINENAWLSGLESCGTGCVVDSANDTVSTCSGGCPKLRFNESTGLYGQNLAWDESIFTRTVTITELNDNEILLSANISWQNGILPKSFSVDEIILNWNVK